MTAMRLKRYPSPSGGIALGKMGVGATMMKQLPYDAEVEYLESSGTQWIDTGVGAGDNVSIEVHGWFSRDAPYVTALGCRYTNSNEQFSFSNKTSSVGYRLDIGNSGSSQWDLNVPGPLKYCFLSAPDRLAKVETMDGSTYSNTFTTSLYFGHHLPIWLFARRTSTGKYEGTLYSNGMRVYKCLILDGSVLVRDFIPVRFTNEQGQTEGAMYDKRGTGGMNPDGTARTDGLYRNRGTGVFRYGSDI